MFSMGIGWQVPRLPGLGDVDWDALFARAVADRLRRRRDHRARGPRLRGDRRLVKRGFLLARDVLRPYIKR